MAKKRKLKRKFKLLLIRIKLLFFLCIFIIVLFYLIKLLFPNKYIEYIDYTNNNVLVSLKSKNELYCILSDKEPNIEDNWVKSDNKICNLKYNNYSNLYIRNDKEIIYSSKKDLYYDINKKDIIYLPLNEKYNYFNYIIGNQNKIKINISNDKIISIDQNGIIHANNIGTSDIEIKINDNEYKSKIVVTNLITSRPKNGYDYKKKYLSCNKYSKEDNDLIDEILKDRIKNAGYKTRAGVVEAARFLTLDFPYRINYFYENGRQTTNNVDGEGRYYHVGLYLDKSRYDNITGKSTGPKAWGCSLYSNPAHRNIDNGLDCSGFVSWALLNGGFDVKDVGAGWSDKADLTDYGEVVKLTKEISSSNKIKVGDLLHSEKAGGHIGIIVGIDNNYYYIAQALWFDEIGVIITKERNQNYKMNFLMLF